MVRSITSLTGSGLKDWLAQRISAVIMALYVCLLAGFFATHTPVSFADLHTLFGFLWMKLMTLFVLISFAVHAWIGMWTVFSDYVKNTVLRISLLILLKIFLVAEIVWCIYILWR